MSLVYTKVMSPFCADLYKGKIRDNNSELKIQAWVKLGGVYFKKGWGWERTEKRIVELRGGIEQYLVDLK